MLFKEIKARKLVRVCRKRPFSSKSIYKTKTLTEPRFAFSVLRKDYVEKVNEIAYKVTPIKVVSKSFQKARFTKKTRDTEESSSSTSSSYSQEKQEKVKNTKNEKKSPKKFFETWEKNSPEYEKFKVKFVKKHGEKRLPVNFQQLLSLKRIKENNALIRVKRPDLNFLNKTMPDFPHKKKFQRKKKVTYFSKTFVNSKKYSSRLKTKNIFLQKKRNELVLRDRKVSGLRKDINDGKEESMKKMIEKFGIAASGGGKYFEAMNRPKSSSIANGVKRGGGRTKVKGTYLDIETSEEGDLEAEFEDLKKIPKIPTYTEQAPNKPDFTGKKKNKKSKVVKTRFFVKRQKGKVAKSIDRKRKRRNREKLRTVSEKVKKPQISKSLPKTRKRYVTRRKPEKTKLSRSEIRTGIRVMEPQVGLSKKVFRPSGYRNKYEKKSKKDRQKAFIEKLSLMKVNRGGGKGIVKDNLEEIPMDYKMKSWRRSGRHHSVSDVDFLF